MKYSLYGHEIDEESNPYAAGLGWVVKPQSQGLFGSPGHAQNRTEEKQKLIGFKLTEKGIPRQGYKLFSFDNNEIGRVTSGTFSPTLSEGIGIAYVDKPFSEVGSQLEIEIRHRRVRATVVKTPFI